MATLIGFGASAINPYVMFESLDELADRSLLPEDLDREEAEKRIVKAIGKGLLKMISKMGISTIQSYCGAQIFEAVGLDRELIDKHFTGTASRIGGIGIERAGASRRWSATSAPTRVPTATCCRSAASCSGAVTASSTTGIPDTVAKLQHSVRGENGDGWQTYEEFARLANDERPGTLDPARADEAATLPEPIPLDEVEPATQIVKRFTDRRDVARRAQPRGARDAGDRDEPARRASRTPARAARTRRASRPTRTATAPLGDQAGRLGPLRRDRALPGQRRPAADQDGPGRKAGRGRPAAGPQGRRLHRRDPPLDPGRRTDLAAAAPRHLLDRGSQAADLRPALRQPERARSRSSSSPRSASAPSPPASPRRTPTTSRSPATTAAPAPRRSRRSMAPASPGRSAWPRPSRR